MPKIRVAARTIAIERPGVAGTAALDMIIAAPPAAAAGAARASADAPNA